MPEPAGESSARCLRCGRPSIGGAPCPACLLNAALTPEPSGSEEAEDSSDWLADDAAAAPAAMPTATASAMPAASTISTVSAAAGGFYLQLGAFSQAANAQAAQALHAQRWNGSLRQVDIVQNNTLFRLYGGPFASRADAEAVAVLAAGTPAQGVGVTRLMV